MKGTKTDHGYTRYDFQDYNGEACSLQDSSSANVPLIWLGVNEVIPQVMTPGRGWERVELPELGPGQHLLTSGRMHLTRDQVAALMPYFVYFIENGDLPIPLPERLEVEPSADPTIDP